MSLRWTRNKCSPMLAALGLHEKRKDILNNYDVSRCRLF